MAKILPQEPEYLQGQLMLMLMLMLMLTLRSWSRDERLLLSFHPQLPRVCIVIVIIMIIIIIYRVFFLTGTPPKSSKYKKVNLGYVNVDSPNLGFPYSNFLGGYQ